MKQVEAIQNFEHGSRRRRGEQFGVSEQHAEQLQRAGLVRVVGEAPDSGDPPEAAGAKSSASPAAPASTEQTATPRARGAKRGQAAQSS